MRWYTEQDVRDGACAPWLVVPHRRGGFRLPDGVFEVATAADEVHRVAVEVERRAERPREYPEKLAWYRRRLDAGAFAHVRWFAGDAETERALLRQVAAAGLDAAQMTVTPLPEGVRLYGRAPDGRLTVPSETMLARSHVALAVAPYLALLSHPLPVPAPAPVLRLQEDATPVLPSSRWR